MIPWLLEPHQFYVKDHGEESGSHAQRSGFSQGCALSPLIFSIVMSVVMQDAICMLSLAARSSYTKGDLADLIYADDTLRMGVSPIYLTERN